MKITKDKVASIHYILTNDDGQEVDSSRKRGEPLTYIQGHKNLIPGMENGLEGREKGDKFQIDVEPKDGYGEVREELIQEVPREQFGEQEVSPGMQFNAQTQQGPVRVTVKEVTSEAITVDANHALAGENLHFDVEVVEVREATDDEIKSGRPEQ